MTRATSSGKIQGLLKGSNGKGWNEKRERVCVCERARKRECKREGECVYLHARERVSERGRERER